MLIPDTGALVELGFPSTFVNLCQGWKKKKRKLIGFTFKIFVLSIDHRQTLQNLGSFRIC